MRSTPDGVKRTGNVGDGGRYVYTLAYTMFKSINGCKICIHEEYRESLRFFAYSGFVHTPLAAVSRRNAADDWDEWRESKLRERNDICHIDSSTRKALVSGGNAIVMNNVVCI